MRGSTSPVFHFGWVRIEYTKPGAQTLADLCLLLNKICTSFSRSLYSWFMQTWEDLSYETITHLIYTAEHICLQNLSKYGESFYNLYAVSKFPSSNAGSSNRGTFRRVGRCKTYCRGGSSRWRDGELTFGLLRFYQGVNAP